MHSMLLRRRCLGGQYPSALYVVQDAALTSELQGCSKHPHLLLACSGCGEALVSGSVGSSPLRTLTCFRVTDALAGSGHWD